DLPKCPEDAEQAGDCIVKILNELIPRLRNGLPELSIPPYDPFVMDRLSFQYESGAAKGRISVRDLKIYGFANQKVQQADVQVKGDKVKLRLSTHVPHMNIMGDYKAEMTINMLQLKPKGKFNITINDFHNTITTDGEFFTKEGDGRRFLRLTDIDARPKIGDLIIKANGIFPDPELDELALNVANNYWRDIYGVLLPETRKSWAPLMLRLVNQGLMNVPIDQFIQA
ncbi:hypothetical protein KR222_009685, partial [Zaprionus bogoriensis]